MVSIDFINDIIYFYVQNRKMKEKSETYRKNIEKRGNVPNSISVRITLF